MTNPSKKEDFSHLISNDSKKTNVQDFDFFEKIGEGAYSTVWKAKRKKDNKLYAIKRIKVGVLDSKDKANTLNEVRILASLSNPFIIPFREAFFDDKLREFWIVTDYAEGGDLYAYLKKTHDIKASFKEEIVWRYLLDILYGLNYLHEKNIVHRDLKGANIFLNRDKSRAMVGDLNVSKIAKNKFLYTQTGTPYYASPEIWRDEPYCYKSDIWSLGCLIYEMWALNPPFMGKSMDELFKQVQK